MLGEWRGHEPGCGHRQQRVPRVPAEMEEPGSAGCTSQQCQEGLGCRERAGVGETAIPATEQASSPGEAVITRLRSHASVSLGKTRTDLTVGLAAATDVLDRSMFRGWRAD